MTVNKERAGALIGKITDPTVVFLLPLYSADSGLYTASDLLFSTGTGRCSR